MQDHDEHAATTTAPRPSPSRPVGRGRVTLARAAAPGARHGDHRGRHHQRGQRRAHCGQELAPGQVEVAEHDQVGQVRAGQEERTGVGQEEAPVEQRRLAAAPAAGGVDEHRGEERHRGVEVQHGRDGAHHDDGADEEECTARRRAGQPVPGAGEEAVVVGHQPDQQQPGDEDERRPVLRSR